MLALWRRGEKQVLGEERAVLGEQERGGNPTRAVWEARGELRRAVTKIKGEKGFKLVK